jgi:hypothetical protein
MYFWQQGVVLQYISFMEIFTRCHKFSRPAHIKESENMKYQLYMLSNKNLLMQRLTFLFIMILWVGRLVLLLALPMFTRVATFSY